MSETELKDYLEFAKKLAYEAGGIMKKYFLATDTVWKSDKTPVTQADTEINSLVIERISAAYPGHSVLGEEESLNKGGEYIWVCDPVDGTMPYAHGLQISTFSLALTYRGRPIVGAVYDPYMDRMYAAAIDQGAYCNDKKITVNQEGVSNALVDVEACPSGKGVLDIDARLNNRLIEAGAHVTVLWSAVLPGCLIASGEYAGLVFNVPKPEDPVALKVIVEEAGGRVTDLFGNEQRYDQPTKGFIASNGIIHDELVKIVQEASDEI